MKPRHVTGLAAVLMSSVSSLPAMAQQSTLPPVEVQQQQQQKKAAAAKAKAAKKPPAQQQAPVVEAPPPAPVEEVPAQANGNTPYGSPAGGPAAARAESSSTNPANPSNILPGNLQGFSSAGTRVGPDQIEQDQPRTTNEALRRVPGVHVVSDDGFARHGGIGLRGSPPRRGRKVLHLEDGQPINMAVWIDPSVHYVPPMDRLESIEVLRGVVINHGPLNNHGVVNFRNLSPFGPNETVIEGTIGVTNNKKGGGFVNDPGDPPVFSTEDNGTNNTRHVHTRQGVGNVGVVFSYSGADVDGSTDLERLRYNDFYGAIGWKGSSSDLTFSATHFRQRDNYDEANFEGTEAQFFDQIGHCKSCYNPGARFNTYNADMTKLQIAHNYYVDDTTTITSRVYTSHHRRDRYQNVEGDPADPGEAVEIYNGVDIFLPEDGVMLGRLRTYRQAGAEVRAELADRPFIAGLRQDIQMGVRYEWNDFKNKNFLGQSGQILEDGDKDGVVTIFDRDYEANSWSAFLQTTLHLTQDLKVTPGARLEYYRIDRKTRVLTREEGELDEFSNPNCANGFNEDGDTSPYLPAGGAGPLGLEDECLYLKLADTFIPSESFSKTHLLPGISFAYEGLFRSTVYGGYNRGLTTHVLREERFPAKDEIGDNFQVGYRTQAFKGLTLDWAAFFNRIENFQIKSSGVDGAGNNVYTTADLVHIKGFEVYGRMDSSPFTGGPLNLYFESTYTLSDAKIESDAEADIVGKYVPEVPKHVAQLTAGFEHKSGLDASVSWTYRGEFFTDEENSAYGSDPEGEDGLVPDVWLLSARTNYKIPNTGATLFVAGDNLLDKLYITDREDGIKAGQGRTIWGGFKLKFN